MCLCVCEPVYVCMCVCMCVFVCTCVYKYECAMHRQSPICRDVRIIVKCSGSGRPVVPEDIRLRRDPLFIHYRFRRWMKRQRFLRESVSCQALSRKSLEKSFLPQSRSLSSHTPPSLSSSTQPDSLLDHNLRKQLLAQHARSASNSHLTL